MESLWTDIKKLFEENSTSGTYYETWIKTSIPISLVGHRFTLQLASPLHRDYWMKQGLDKKLVEYAYQAQHIDIQPVLVLEDELKAQEIEQGTETVTPTFMRETKLNPKYTFDTFVIGKGNQMANAAALVVSEEPGKMYNPLFFYGGAGLGKTHLMHAIGNHMKQAQPQAKVKYVTSEAFTNDLVNAIRTRTQEAFRQEYRGVDLLLVDDIQFFSGKDSIQEEFFHTFNALHDESKQIVLTSDRLPNEIPDLEDRLVSRFAWGLSVDITPPDLETRTAILLNKANADQIEISIDTVSYIAGQIDSNVRELEGALTRVHAYAKLKNEPITTDLAAQALRDMKGTSDPHELSIPVIQDKVAKYFHVSLSDLKGKKRMKAIVIPRQIAMYLSRELTDASLPRIGSEFGGKDHTTVIHAYDKIAESLKADTDLQKNIAALKNELGH